MLSQRDWMLVKVIWDFLLDVSFFMSLFSVLKKNFSWADRVVCFVFFWGCDIEWFTQRHMYAKKTCFFLVFLADICGIQLFTRREEKRPQSKRCSKFGGRRTEKRPQTKRSSKFRGNGVLNPMRVLRTEMHAMRQYLRLNCHRLRCWSFWVWSLQAKGLKLCPD